MQTLEFAKIKEQILKYNINALSRKKIENLQPFFYYEQVQEELEKTKEGYLLKNSGSFPSLTQIIDLDNPLGILKKGGLLSLTEIYDFYTQQIMIYDLKQFLKENKLETPHIHRLLTQLTYCSEIVEKIKKCIDINFHLYDTASEKLKKIRSDIKSSEGEVKIILNRFLKQNSEYLAENLIVSRGNHLVVPVKATYKNHIQGILLDVSETKQTYYIEPYCVVEKNIEIENLHYEEIVEENRIIKALCQLLSHYQESLRQNNSLLAEISFIYLKGSYGVAENLEIAHLVQKQEIYLKRAKHPLIAAEKVIANDYILGNKAPKMIVISGPNAGGKTVALKTVALLLLMNQCGLPLPCSEATLGVFSSIFVDIGDDQSIENSLSGFSSHIYHLKKIIEKITPQSFVALDELGSKTDPVEGEALAKAVIDFIVKKESLAMISTHYVGIKDYAKNENHILLASMSFDTTTFTPTYHLLTNVVGRSYALEIAARMGLPVQIIDQARIYKKENAQNMEKVIDELTEKLLLEKEKLKSIEDLERKLLEKEEKLRKKEEELEKRKFVLHDEIELEKEEFLLEAEEKLENLFQELKQKGELKLHHKTDAKQKIEGMFKKEEKTKEKIVDEELAIHDDVYIIPMQKEAKLVSIKGDNCIVLVNNKQIQIKKSNLKKMKKEKEKKKKPTKSVYVNTISKSVPSSLNVVGLHVDEALLKLEQYLDDALLLHYKTVTIIHGTGTGTLKKAVEEYLKNKKFVESYRKGVYGEGGIGVTVVNLK